MKKNILIISPYFAPYQGVGALRMTSLYKYINLQQNNVFLLKASNQSYGGKYKEIGEETFVFDANLSDSEELKTKIIDSTSKIIIDKKIDVILASFGPFVGVVQAMIYIKKQFDVKLIIDYRDFWLNNIQRRTNLYGWISKKMEWMKYRKTEKELLTIADSFVVATPYMEKIMSRKYPLVKEKIKTVFNGYTPLEIKDEKETSKYIDICILGKFSYYSPKKTEMLLKAIKEKNDKGTMFRVKHIGVEEETVLKVIEKIKLPNQFYINYGQNEYEKAMKIASNSDMFILIENSKIGIATKVFDYIFMDKPIIAVAPKGGEIEKEFKKQDNNFFICNSKKEVIESLEKIINDRKICFTENKTFIEQFSRDYQNKAFYDIINNV